VTDVGGPVEVISAFADGERVEPDNAFFSTERAFGYFAAKRDAEAARGELASTLANLQQRLKPGALANQAWSGVRDAARL